MKGWNAVVYREKKKNAKNAAAPASKSQSNVERFVKFTVWLLVVCFSSEQTTAAGGCGE